LNNQKKGFPMTLAERLKAIKELQANKAAPAPAPTLEATPTPTPALESTPTPTLEPTAGSLIANLRRAAAQHGDYDETVITDVVQGTPLDDAVTFERTHGVAEFNLEHADIHQLFHLINSPSLAKEFGVSDLEIYTRAYNLEIVKVSQLTIPQIEERIASLQKLVKANNAMQQACIAMAAKKEKEFRDSLLGLPIDEQHKLLRKHEDEKWERENKKKILARREKIKTDSTGAIIGKRNELLSDEEKNIRKLMKLGFSRKDAEKMLK
jgi:hypothetical protein